MLQLQLLCNNRGGDKVYFGDSDTPFCVKYLKDKDACAIAD